MIKVSASEKIACADLSHAGVAELKTLSSVVKTIGSTAIADGNCRETGLTASSFPRKKKMNYIKRKIVSGLETACELTGHHWCFRLATWSIKLDRRWGTGMWREVEKDED